MYKIFFLLNLVFLNLALSSCAHPALSDTGKIKPEPQHGEVAKALSDIVAHYHYKKPDINDSLSSQIFDRYFKDMDNNRLFFLSSDISSFEKYRYQLDDFLKSGDLSVPYAIFNRYVERANKAIAFVLQQLDSPVAVFSKDSIQLNREKSPWAASQAEMNALWKKKMSYELISLDLVKKDSVKNIATLKKRYKDLKKQIDKYHSEDVFSFFMNAFAACIDPHTTYFSPHGMADFNIEMSKSLEGIGATLVAENDFIKIAALTKGGPAAKSKLLNPNDRITAVAQGKAGEFVDIIGWRTDDAVQLIRGAKGTVVRLKILSAGSSASSTPKTVELVRDKINISEQRASSVIKEIKRNGRNYKIGVITLGDFYLDFEAQSRGDKNYNSTTRDIHRILDSLQKSGIDGVVIDLRSNGGGSLAEAINLTGLFIKQGPVVQVKNYDGKIEVDSDKDPQAVYSGPLAVLTNRFSASASEIFAAAIQDYGRGVVVGEQTYGKGTVQTAFNINEMLPILSRRTRLGQFNLTIAKFYRINGSSTQRKGVTPDIEFPSKFPEDKFGESSEPAALPWDQIRSSKFEPMGNVPSQKVQLVANHTRRMTGNEFYEEWLSDVKSFNDNLNKTTAILDERKLRTAHDREEKEDLHKYNELRKLAGLAPIASANGDSVRGALKKTIPGKYAGGERASRTFVDPELLIKLESFQVIADMVDMGKNKAAAAVIKRDNPSGSGR